jgi:23S rRNA (pseudouridine1915-N3)-methyltransferase
MKVRFILASKIKDKEFKVLINEYLKRLSPYVKTELIDFKISDSLDKEKALDLEAQKLLKLSENFYRVALDPNGKKFSTLEFSNWFLEYKNKNKDIAFLIGSAFGFSEKLKSNVDIMLSLSEMTMAHKIAMLVLTEQVYRAITIINGHPYHK